MLSPISARMRASVGGCVLKSDIEPAARERLDDEHVRRRRVGVQRHALGGGSILRSASASPYGLPAICGAAGVGANSRDREIATWISIAAIGARIIIASSAIGFAPCRDRRCRPPPNIPAYIAMRATIMIAAADRRRDRADQDVAMLHVRQLVRDHAFELTLAQHPQDPFGRRDGRVLRDCGRSRTRSATDPE